jgi:hypothetical protein
MDAELEKFVCSKKGPQIVKLLADRLPEGVVFVDNAYKIVYVNRVLRNEFLKSSKAGQRIVGKPYFDFFFKPGMTQEERAKYPLYKAFSKHNATRFQHTQLARNNNYYDIVTYPMQFQSPPSLVVEVWSEFASKELVDSLEKYKELR